MNDMIRMSKAINRNEERNTKKTGIYLMKTFYSMINMASPIHLFIII